MNCSYCQTEFVDTMPHYCIPGRNYLMRENAHMREIVVELLGLLDREHEIAQLLFNKVAEQMTENDMKDHNFYHNDDCGMCKRIVELRKEYGEK